MANKIEIGVSTEFGRAAQDLAGLQKNLTGLSQIAGTASRSMSTDFASVSKALNALKDIDVSKITGGISGISRATAELAKQVGQDFLVKGLKSNIDKAEVELRRHATNMERMAEAYRRLEERPGAPAEKARQRIQQMMGTGLEALGGAEARVAAARARLPGAIEDPADPRLKDRDENVAKMTGNAVAGGLRDLLTGRMAQAFGGAVGGALGGMPGSLLGSFIGRQAGGALASMGGVGFGVTAGLGLAAYGAYQAADYMYDPNRSQQRMVDKWAYERQAGQEALQGDFVRQMMRSRYTGTAEQVRTGQASGWAQAQATLRHGWNWLGYQMDPTGQTWEQRKEQRDREAWEETDRAMYSHMQVGQVAAMQMSQRFVREQRTVGYDPFMRNMIGIQRLGINEKLASPVVRAMARYRGTMATTEDRAMMEAGRDYAFSDELTAQMVRRRGRVGDVLSMMGGAGMRGPMDTAAMAEFGDVMARRAGQYGAEYGAISLGGGVAAISGQIIGAAGAAGIPRVDVIQAAGIAAGEASQRGMQQGSLDNMVQVSTLMKKYGIDYKTAVAMASRDLSTSQAREEASKYLGLKGYKVSPTEIGASLRQATAATTAQMLGTDQDDPAFREVYKMGKNRFLAVGGGTDLTLARARGATIEGAQFDVGRGAAPGRAARTVADEQDKAAAQVSAEYLRQAGTSLSGAATELKGAAKAIIDSVSGQADAAKTRETEASRRTSVLRTMAESRADAAKKNTVKGGRK